MHIVNLIAKAILKQFDAPKKRSKDMDMSELEELAEDIEAEELKTRMDAADDDEGDIDSSIDPRDGMTEEEEEALDLNVQPIRLILTKVSDLAVC